MNAELLRIDTLKGIFDLLALESPDLQHHIASIVKRGPVPRVLRRGQSTFPSCRMEIRLDDALAILAVLEKAGSKYDNETKFYGYSLVSLYMEWLGFVTREQSKLA